MIAESDEMAKKKAAEPEKPTVGGRREGAGRKPSEFGRKIQKEVYLTPDVLAFLNRHGVATGVAIEQMVRASTSFKKWMASR